MSSTVTPHDQFEQCLEKARAIVASYRSQAPDGCDPQNTWVAVAVGAASITGSVISAAGSAKAAKSAAANQQKAFGKAQSYLDSLAAGKMGNLEDIFGSELDPEAFLYHPVDITQSQLDTISGNLQAFPRAVELTNRVNPSIWKNDLSRIRELMPGFDNSRDMYLGNTKRLLAGELPFQDVEDIVSNRSSMSAMLGSPGGSRNATLRDLGLSRMDAMNQGGSMFQQFIQMAQAISPVESQMRPQQMMFTPQERLQADILQRSLEQQGNASAAMAEAMPDPAQNALANANIGLNMAGIGASYQPTSGLGMQALGQGISSAAGLFGSIYGMRGGQSQTPSFNSPGALYGGGRPVSDQSAFASNGIAGPTYYGGGFSTVQNGVGVNPNGTSSFLPYAQSNSAGMSNSLFPTSQQSYSIPSYLGKYGGGWYKDSMAGGYGAQWAF